MLIGEAPGPNTNAKLPLFPEPSNSAAGRLLRYANIEPDVYMGRLVRMNMCDGAWSERRAISGVIRALSYLLDPINFCGDAPLRVLLLGRRVADAWNCGTSLFGYECRDHAELKLQIAWIPHPSGRNLAYRERKNQLRARHALLWSIGERWMP